MIELKVTIWSIIDFIFWWIGFLFCAGGGLVSLYKVMTKLIKQDNYK